MNNEEWKDVDGASNYQISNRGRVRSKTRTVFHSGSKVNMKLKGKLMKQRTNKTAKAWFLDVKDDNGNRKTLYPHVEVAKAFVNQPSPEHTMIVHLDNNWRNNKVENLKWMTPSEHMKWHFSVGNKNNFKVWKTRKKKYANGFKPDTILPGRPPKIKVA